MVVFDIGCKLRYAAVGRTEFVFNVQSMRTRQQAVLRESLVIDGVAGFTEYSDPIHGGRYVRARAESGRVSLDYRSTISVLHVLRDPALLVEHPVSALPDDTLVYLRPSRYCPSDQMAQLALREFGDLPRGYARAEAVCNWVKQQIRFIPGSTHSGTTALDALAQRAGVCRDYAHVLISLLRALNMPARFVSGYDYGAPRELGPTDFHAYVEAFLGQRWWIFDATGLVPRNGLIRIGTGRDAADCAFATLFGPTEFAGMDISIEPRSGKLTDDRALAVSTAGIELHSPHALAHEPRIDCVAA